MIRCLTVLRSFCVSHHETTPAKSVLGSILSLEDHIRVGVLER